MGRKRTRRTEQTTDPAATPAPTPVAEVEAARNDWAVLVAEVRSQLPLLGVIAVLALAIRFFQLGESNLWMDEIVMLREASAGKYSIISFRTHATHLLPVEWCLRMFGSSDWGLRFWSALLGSLAVPILALWAGLSFGRKATPWMGALAGLNCFLVMYAQDGNYYGGMTFYTATLLLGMALFFRGAFWVGIGIMVISAALGFSNHPVFLLPIALAFSLVGIGGILFQDIRQRLIEFRPQFWPLKPFLPLMLGAVIAGTMVLWKRGSSLVRIIEPGNSKLTNVEPGMSFVFSDLYFLLINFFRPFENAVWLIIPMLAILASIAMIYFRGWGQLSNAAKGSVLFSAILPVAAYFVLFGITVERAYYTRYFIFLIPAFLALMLAWCTGESENGKGRWLGRGGLVLVSLHLLVSGYYTGRYFAADLSNYDAAVENIKAIPADEPIFLPHRNDLVQARYFVGLAGRATTSPGLSYLFEHGVAGRFDAPMRAHFAMGGKMTLLSAWREAPAPGLWSLVTEEMTPIVRGTSRMGPEYDVILAQQPAQSFFDTTATSFGPLDSIAWPSHAYTREVAQGGGTALRFERDDRVEFVLTQPDALERMLVVRYAARPAGDPVAAKNRTPLPSEMLLAVSVDGITRAVYTIPASPHETAFSIPLKLELGAHRVGLYFTAPRLQYSPYFPWQFHRAEWRIKAPTDEDPESLPLDAGWQKPPAFGDPSGGSWSWSGSDSVIADASLRGPAGDPAVRIDVPVGSNKSISLFAPPVPVTPGKIAAFSYHARWQGLEHAESNGAMVFLDKSGKPMGSSIPANGPNYRGSLPPGVWVRRDIVVPVPDGAAAMAVGLQIMPIKPLHESSGGRFYVSSFVSPGCTTPIPDLLIDRVNSAGGPSE